MARKKSMPGTQVLVIIWFSLLASLAMYFGVLIMLAEQEPAGMVLDVTEDTVSNVPLMSLLFAGLAVILVGFTVFYRRQQFFEPMKRGDFKHVEDLAARYQTACILTWSLCEAIAIFGFVLSILSMELVYFYYFAGPAVLLMLYFRPRLDTLAEQWRAMPANQKAAHKSTSKAKRDARPDKSSPSPTAAVDARENTGSDDMNSDDNIDSTDAW